MVEQLGESGVLKEVKLHGPVAGREWIAERGETAWSSGWERVDC